MSCAPPGCRLPSPCGRSPSQWPDTLRVASSTGRSAIDVMLGMWPRRSVPCDRGRGVLCTPERGQQLGAQASTWQHIQGGIDALVRESRSYVVRLCVSETPGNLFGRTSLVQVGADIGPEPRVQELARPSWLTSPSRCQTLQCRPATESRVHCACIRGSWCCARAATNTLAVTLNGRPWARPKLRVSRSSALMCA